MWYVSILYIHGRLGRKRIQNHALGTVEAGNVFESIQSALRYTRSTKHIGNINIIYRVILISISQN